jgi:hypothetical protein
MNMSLMQAKCSARLTPAAFRVKVARRKEESVSKRMLLNFNLWWNGLR